MSNLRTASQLSHLEALTSQADDGFWQGQFRSLRLSSVFQPVVTLSTGRVVGHEGLVRLDYADGRGATPFRFFSGGLDEAGLVELDTLCRLLHLRNFQGQAGTADGWLFLNVSPLVVASHRRHGEFLANMLDKNGFDPARVVVEIAESGVQDGDTLADAVAHYRQIGCLVAIDDYGVGLSSLTRLWSLGVDIVKLDRELLLAALARHEERRLLPGLVEFLHDCGALVLMEGVETYEEAMLALEVGCDLAQGFHFAFPAPVLRDRAQVIPIDMPRAVSSTPAGAAPVSSWPDVWRLQLVAAAQRLAGGATLADATAPMLDEISLLRCYWLDVDGIQRSDSLLGARAGRPRFAMLLDQPGADASGRGFFARAVANPDSVQRSRAYLQRGFGVACVTLAVTASLAGAPGVLCCDVAWRA